MGIFNFVKLGMFFYSGQDVLFLLVYLFMYSPLFMKCKVRRVQRHLVVLVQNLQVISFLLCHVDRFMLVLLFVLLFLLLFQVIYACPCFYCVSICIMALHFYFIYLPFNCNCYSLTYFVYLNLRKIAKGKLDTSLIYCLILHLVWIN